VRRAAAVSPFPVVVALLHANQGATILLFPCPPFSGLRAFGLRRFEPGTRMHNCGSMMVMFKGPRAGWMLKLEFEMRIGLVKHISTTQRPIWNRHKHSGGLTTR